MRLFWCAFYILILAISVKSYHHDKKEFAKDPWRGLPMICSMEDPKNVSISCHGVRIIKRVIQQLLESAANVPSIELTEGISLVETNDNYVRKARTMKGSIFDFIEGRELRVRLPSLLPNNFESAIIDSIPEGRGKNGNGGGLGGFGGGKKGDNSMLILAVMMGKMLGMMAFGALGLLTMKALGVSALALVLSLINAAKKYSGASAKSDDEHHVVYAQEIHGHHEKRSLSDLNISPYRGYIDIQETSKSM